MVHEEQRGLCSEIGGQVRQVRKAAGLTQAMLADKTWIAQADISRLEHGLGNPSLRTLARLAEGMGCTLKIWLDAGEDIPDAAPGT